MKRESAAAELARLRGDRTMVEWSKQLGVGYRTYLRYEQGQREPPEPTLRLARIIGTKRKRGA